MADLASYRAKTGLWSKPFIWKASLSVPPLTWWNGMCASRPLAVIAKKILSLPATSAACERRFSTYGNIHTAKRNRLTTSRAGKLVYISQNLKMLTADSKLNINRDDVDWDDATTPVVSAADPAECSSSKDSEVLDGSTEMTDDESDHSDGDEDVSDDIDVSSQQR